MRSRVIIVLAVVSIALGGLLIVPAAYAWLNEEPSATNPDLAPSARSPSPPVAPDPPTLKAAPVSVSVDGFVSWALLDRDSGSIAGSDNLDATNSTESMIKIWIVADFLRELGDRTPSPQRQRQASLAIRDSDDNSADSLYSAAGGPAVIERMIRMCRLTETEAVVPTGQRSIWWSYTKISAQDAVRLGECVKNGTAAGRKWTDWLLNEMAQVRGSTAAKDQRAQSGGGRWGIIDGLPQTVLDQTEVSIKNGWTLIWADGMWHLNCLAIADTWVLAVLMRYSGDHGLDYGAGVCKSVAAQLVTPHLGGAIRVPISQTPPVEG